MRMSVPHTHTPHTSHSDRPSFVLSRRSCSHLTHHHCTCPTPQSVAVPRHNAHTCRRRRLTTQLDTQPHFKSKHTNLKSHHATPTQDHTTPHHTATAFLTTQPMQHPCRGSVLQTKIRLRLHTLLTTQPASPHRKMAPTDLTPPSHRPRTPTQRQTHIRAYIQNHIKRLLSLVCLE